MVQKCLAEAELEATGNTGPGGQNVNKVWTAVRLRFDVRRSATLDDATKTRLEKLAGRRVSSEGVLTIRANRFRTQNGNRADAISRFGALLQQAVSPPRIRKPTKPGTAAKEQRLHSKRHRSRIKQERRAGGALD